MDAALAGVAEVRCRTKRNVDWGHFLASYIGLGRRMPIILERRDRLPVNFKNLFAKHGQLDLANILLVQQTSIHHQRLPWRRHTPLDLFHLARLDKELLGGMMLCGYVTLPFLG